MKRLSLHNKNENTTFVEKVLQTTGGKQVPANPGRPDKDKNTKASNEKPDKKPKEEKPKKEKDKEKPDKPTKEKKGQSTESSASVNAAPGPSKGAGKGKKSDSKKQLSKEEKAQEPCMYFAFSSCTKGDKCPYLHDKNNLHKGPKPTSLEKNTLAGSATVHAGAAKLLAGSIAASSVVGTRGVCSLAAPHLEAESSGNAVVDTCRKAWRGLTKQGGSAVGKGKRVVKSALKQKCFGQPLFEKAFKCFAAMAMVCRVSTGISCRFWSW
jgi:hypothetical protein